MQAPAGREGLVQAASLLCNSAFQGPMPVRPSQLPSPSAAAPLTPRPCPTFQVIIIQPQVQTQPESTAEPRPPTEEPSQGAQATKKKEEDRPPSQENPEVGWLGSGHRCGRWGQQRRAQPGGSMAQGLLRQEAGLLAPRGAAVTLPLFPACGHSWASEGRQSETADALEVSCSQGWRGRGS